MRWENRRVESLIKRHMLAVSLFDLKVQNEFMVADKLDARDAKSSVEVVVLLRDLGIGLAVLAEVFV